MSVTAAAPTPTTPAATGGQVESANATEPRMRLNPDNGLLKVRTKRHLRGWLVEVSGEMDLSNAGILETELQRLNGDLPVVLDLSHLDFMDSAGLTVLVRAADPTRSGARSLAIRNASGQVERLLRLCGLDTRLAVVPLKSETAAG